MCQYAPNDVRIEQHGLQEGARHWHAVCKRVPFWARVLDSSINQAIRRKRGTSATMAMRLASQCK